MNPSKEPMGRLPTGSAAGPSPADDIPNLLCFPDAARLELDRAVQDLLDRAGEVLRTQGRLRDLLRAVLAITADVTSPTVVDHLLTTARDLLRARYAALAVFHPSGGLAEFRQTGTDHTGAQALERCRPGDEAVLRQLADGWHPLRIDDLTAHPALAAWAPGPTPLRTFLGVPVHARGQTLGVLCLADKTGPHTEPEPFSDEDEELAGALTRAAGLAIDNARMFEQIQRRQQWQRATTEITATLLTGTDPDQALASIAGQARQAADADLAAVAVPENPDRLVIRLATGRDAEALAGQHLPAQGSLCGHVLADGKPLISDHMAADGRAHAPGAAWSARLGPAMLAPLSSGEDPAGVLFVTRQPGRPVFDEPQLDALTGFAAQAALAQHLAAQRANAQLLARVEDHERIAQGLRDRVIEEIFAVSLTLNKVAGTAPGDLREQVLDTISRLDTVIKDIRATVFDLQHPGRGTAHG